MPLHQIGPVYGRGADVDEDLLRPRDWIGYLLPDQSLLVVFVYDDGLQTTAPRYRGKAMRGTAVERSATIPRQAREVGDRLINLVIIDD